MTSDLFQTTAVQSELNAGFEESPLFIFFFDADDRLRYANCAFRHAFALAPDEQPTWSELMEKCYIEHVGVIIKTSDFAEWLSSAKMRHGKEPYRAHESDLHDGRWMWITETILTDGSMLCIGSDITKLKTDGRTLRQDRDTAERSALTDSLTGISNRRHILQQLDMRLGEVHSKDHVCGVALVDLDNFKAINDAYGHDAGDRVLKHFARTVSETLRPGDGFGRLGGEEFLLLFPGVESESFEGIINRILQIIREARPLSEDLNFSYSFSAGLSELSSAVSAAEVYKQIDTAMYEAKKCGRNSFRWVPKPK